MPIANLALRREIEALRVAMATAIQFGTIAEGQRTVELGEVRQGIRSQGLNCGDDAPAFVLAVLDNNRYSQPWGDRIVATGRRSAQAETDIDRGRSGSDYNNHSDFVTTPLS